MAHKLKDFSIDDAFQETPEDKIRIYNSSESDPLNRSPSPPSLSSAHDDVFVSNNSSSTERPILKNSLPVNPSLQALQNKTNEDTTSQDSTSLIQGGGGGGYYGGPQQSKFWWKHPKIKQNWKMVLAACLLVFIGAGLIITGIFAYALPSLAGIQGFVFFIAGIICLLPGGYHLVYIYLAVKGKRGFDFHHLPLFN